ncbi:hypothetical protein MCERE19_03483 [Spirosomataceae bacterium]
MTLEIYFECHLKKLKNWHQVRDQIFNDHPVNPSRNQVTTIFNTYRPQ